jgi:ankyrin repeat protein
VELLLKIRRSPEGANKDGFTCLHAAAEQGHFDVARLLLSPKYHANPNVFSKQQTTPLYHAVKVGNVDLVDLLLQCGADPALGQKGGWKPIHEACRGGNAEIVRLLMEYGGYSFVDEPNYAVKVRCRIV